MYLRAPRRRKQTAAAKLQASLERFGLCRPILIDAEGTIVEGHGLWEVARKQGVSEVPCIVIDHLDRTELRALGVALNRLGETGAWDPDALRLEFEELTVLGVDLVETGFETAEKRQPTVKPLAAVDRSPEAREKARRAPAYLRRLLSRRQGAKASRQRHTRLASSLHRSGHSVHASPSCGLMARCARSADTKRWRTYISKSEQMILSYYATCARLSRRSGARDRPEPPTVWSQVRSCNAHQEVCANPRDFLVRRIARHSRDLRRHQSVNQVYSTVCAARRRSVRSKVSGNKIPFPGVAVCNVTIPPISNGPWVRPRHFESVRTRWISSSPETKQRGWIVRYVCASAWSPCVRH